MVKFPNHYDQIYIVCYPKNAGGNFLINCLSLADDCVFANDHLARKQLKGEFDLYQKKLYLSEHLAEAKNTKIWRDLQLGNSHLFGFDYFWDNVNTNFIEIIQYQTSSVVNHIINAGKKFFLVCHDIKRIDTLKQMWPQAKLILFVNYRSFINQRAQLEKEIVRHAGLQEYWQRVNDPSWPKNPPNTLSEFRLLPDRLRLELEQDFDFEISRHFDFSEIFDQKWLDEVARLETSNSRHTVIWNVERAYRDQAALNLCLRELADRFGFDIVDPDTISWYYDLWLDTIINNVEVYELQKSFDQ